MGYSGIDTWYMSESNINFKKVDKQKGISKQNVAQSVLQYILVNRGKAERGAGIMYFSEFCGQQERSAFINISGQSLHGPRVRK